MNRNKLFIIITTLTVLLIIISGFITSIYTRQKLTENLITQYGVQEGVVARQLAQTLEIEIAQTQAKLNLIAKLPAVMLGNKDVCNKELKKIFDNPETEVGNLGRVDENGFFRCSLNEKLIGLKAEKLGPYITTIFNDPEHKPVMSRAIKPPGSPSYVVAIHVPVWGVNGEFLGTLGGAVYFNDLEKKYLKNVNIAPGSYIALFDDDGTILYHYKPEVIGLNIASPDFQKFIVGGTPPQQTIQDIQNAVSGSRRYSFDKSQKIASFNPVHIFPGRLWRVVVTVPIQAAQDSISAAGITRFLIELPTILGIITFGLFGFFLWITKREIFSPMEAVDKAKSEFVSLASHQLRTPLSTINWYAEMLLAGDAGTLSPEQKQFMDEIYKGNQRMVELVNALLNVSRIDLGTFAIDPEPTDLRTISDSLLTELMPQIKTREVIVDKKYDPDFPTLFLDPKLMRIVIQNLLTNAIKYTPAKGQVMIDLSRMKTMVEIKVSDTGFGIPKDQQSKIFTKLFRADNVREKETDGTGLGLYIVKSIIEQSGGSVRFDSVLDKGTTFYVTIPIVGMKKKEGVKGLS